MEAEDQKAPAIPEKVYAGEIHYSRIPVEYWQHRLKMTKALGLNTLSVYIMWNYHETARGVFDFQTGNKNLPKFLQMAKDTGFKVLIRPGPYVCAEWDFGGMPSRLLNIPNLKIRANNEKFLEQTKIYFKALVPILKPFLKDETIIMLQIQNEYGFYGTDKSYMEAIRQMWRDLQFGPVEEFYVDWIENISKCHWKGANIGINNAINKNSWQFVRNLQPKGKLFGGQIYSGWMTHWGSYWGGKAQFKVLQEYEFLLSNNHSFAMYMVHGGTNFGLTGGANGLKNKKSDYHAAITSYDYDAPINEQGAATEKYNELRKLIIKNVSWDVPDVPAPIKLIQIPQFTPKPYASLLANIGEPKVRNSQKPIVFESDQLKMYDQGFALYQTTLPANNYKFQLVVHDFALVYVDNVFVQALDRSSAKQHQITINCTKESTLRILVEAMGHINFDHDMETDFKGLISFEDDKKSQFKWNIYAIPINQSTIFNWNKLQPKSFPTVSRIVLPKEAIKEKGDTYLDMKNFKKGYLWVNGHNLGRYWNKGPQERLFCPGVWLKQAENEVVVLQLLDDQTSSISGKKVLFEQSGFNYMAGNVWKHSKDRVLGWLGY